MLRKVLLRIHRGEGRVFGGVKRTILWAMTVNLRPPRFLRGLFYAAYTTHYAVRDGLRLLASIFYRTPLFMARCDRVGKNLHVWLMPHVSGPVKIFLGDDVKIFGHVSVISGRVLDEPRLEIGDGVNLGHNVSITVNKEVIIEEKCNIASGVKIVDTDAHPRNPEDRLKGVPPPVEEIKPVRICRGAWLSANCMILKGVTVGEGAVVGSGSIVITDVPPYSVVMGNPARVVVKDVRATLSS